MMLNNSPQETGFLTYEESDEVDQALLSSREKFSARVAIYSLRVLKQIAQQQGVAIADVSESQIIEWVKHDQSIKVTSGDDLDTDNPSFTSFFTQLVLSSLRPLSRIAAAAETTLEDATSTQVIAWFEQEAKIRVEQSQD